MAFGFKKLEELTLKRLVLTIFLGIIAIIFIIYQLAKIFAHEDINFIFFILLVPYMALKLLLRNFLIYLDTNFFNGLLILEDNGVVLSELTTTGTYAIIIIELLFAFLLAYILAKVIQKNSKKT